MEFNLLPILNCEGKRLPIDVSLQIESRPGDTFRILEPVTVTGEMVNIGGSLELEAQGKAKLALTCDRCAEDFNTEISFEIRERFKKEDSDGTIETNPDIVILEGNTLDLDELVYDAVVLNLPTKVLCSEDCKGLCLNCGQNLNRGTCGCDNRPTDPRFDVLDQLL
ncbi:MAG: DUF177 domain-containing protein [Clostridia bacterium]|nr:DUF177 domain-containing protein [Clostridia bacterium]